jgi:hypothetical protein
MTTQKSSAALKFVLAFALLLISTVICLTLVLTARYFYPRPHDLEVKIGDSTWPLC